MAAGERGAMPSADCNVDSAAGAALRDHTAHVTQRLDRWIIFGLGIGGAKFPRPCAGRDRHRKQSNEQYCGPPNAGAAVHWQLRPPVMVSVTGEKGSTKLARFPCQRSLISPKERAILISAYQTSSGISLYAMSFGVNDG